MFLAQMYADYDENEIGPLDCEEIEGHVPESSDILLQYAQEFEKSQQREKLDKEAIMTKISEVLDSDSECEEEMVYMPVPEKEKWDCESILSTYSNIYNHPKLIRELPVSILQSSVPFWTFKSCNYHVEMANKEVSHDLIFDNNIVSYNYIINF